MLASDDTPFIFRQPVLPRETKLSPPLELRDAFILAAWEVIAEQGAEKLSLRQMARKLGVSHQAPYKHYP